MNPRIYEKLFPTATIYELFAGRRPEFRGKAAVQNLKRQRIEATFEKHNDDFVCVRATATDSKHVKYLEEREYQHKRLRKTIKAKPENTYPDVVQAILARPRNGPGGGITLTRGEVAMLFLDRYAGDGSNLLDIRSQGYGQDGDWYGLTVEDVIEDENTAFVWEKWEPLELWP